MGIALLAHEGTGGGLPPTANRGVDTTKLTGRGIDFLSMTVPASTAATLEASTDLEDEGRPSIGFKRSERRVCPGGHAWRKREPFQASKRWGTAYESWEWESTGAGWPSEFLRGRECKPTRIDVAFDFDVPEDFLADHFAEAVRSHAEARGLTIGISGQGNVNTRYIGAAESIRRVRVYRKDFQRPLWAEMFGPTLRVELILKDEQAEAFWRVWCEDTERAFAAAAAHVAELTGVIVQTVGDVPQLIEPEGIDEAASIFEFMRQHGPRLAAWDEAGLPVLDMARRQRLTASRMTQHRCTGIIRRVRDLTVQHIVSLVEAMREAALRRRSGATAAAGASTADGGPRHGA